MGFCFPSPIAAHLGNISIFLTLFPSIVFIFTCPGFVSSSTHPGILSSFWLSDHWNGPFLSLEEMSIEKSTSYSKLLFSVKLRAVTFCKAGLWTGQILLSWIPGLWSYYLPGSLISGSWILALCGVLDLAWIVLCLQSSLLGSKFLQIIRVVEVLCKDQGPWPEASIQLWLHVFLFNLEYWLEFM